MEYRIFFTFNLLFKVTFLRWWKRTKEKPLLISKQVNVNSDITKYVQFNDSIQLIEKVPSLIIHSPTSPPPATRRRKSPPRQSRARGRQGWKKADFPSFKNDNMICNDVLLVVWLYYLPFNYLRNTTLS